LHHDVCVSEFKTGMETKPVVWGLKFNLSTYWVDTDNQAK